MEKEAEYVELLKALRVVGEVVKGTEVDERVETAEKLFLKFYRHADSAFYLYSRYREVKRLDIIDVGSISIIGRAAFESFLLFHYIFVEPEKQDEKDFRYWVWLLKGELKIHQCLQMQLGANGLVLKEIERSVEELRQKLHRNHHFQELTPKQRKRILTDLRSDSFPPRSCIAASAGLHTYWVDMFSKPLNDYVHSGSMSTRQAQQNQEMLQVIVFPLLKIAMAFMVRAYVKLFPELSSNLVEKSKRVIELWTGIGSRSLARNGTPTEGGMNNEYP